MKIFGKEIRFIDGVKQAWQLFSVQLSTLLILLDALSRNWVELKEFLPDGWVGAFGTAIIVGRVIQQTKAGVAGR